MTDFLGKKYQVESSENLDEYLKAIGNSEMFRSIVVPLVITVQLLEEDGKFVLKTFSKIRNVEMIFESGVEFEETSNADGTKIKSTITVDKNTMIHVQKYPHINTRIERTFSDTELIAVLTAGDIVCTRKFRLVE